MRLTVVPSYGRDYQDAQSVIDHWNAEKDFTIMDMSSKWDGRYINKQQTTKGDEIKIRYYKKERLVVVAGGPEPVVLTQEEKDEADGGWN